jgi:hypothetical protein
MKAFIIQDDGRKNFSSVVNQVDEVRILCARDCPLFDDEDIRVHVSKIKDKLMSYDPDNDVIVLVGDPVNIGLVTAEVLRKGGGRFLKYHRSTETYRMLTLKENEYHASKNFRQIGTSTGTNRKH